MTAQTEFSIYPKELPEATIVRVHQTLGKGAKTPSLELQVRIGNQDQNVLLRLDALKEFDISGPAGVGAIQDVAEELSRIRGLISEIHESGLKLKQSQ